MILVLFLCYGYFLFNLNILYLNKKFFICLLIFIVINKGYVIFKGEFIYS